MSGERRSHGSISEVRPGVWTVRVSAGVSRATGERRRIQRTVRGSRRTAEAALTALLVEAGEMPEGAYTLRDFLEQVYIPWARENRWRAKTAESAEGKLRLHVIGPLGDIQLSDLTPYRLERWISGISEKSRPGCYQVLSAALKRAARWGMIAASPLDRVDRPRVERAVVKNVLSADELGELLDLFRGHWIEPVVILAASCGLRRSEILALDWRDVDFTAATVTVERGCHRVRGREIFEDPKSATSRRVVAVPSWALARLRETRGLGPIASTPSGGRAAPDSVTRAYIRAVRASGIRYVPLKNLRHSHACGLLAAGVDIYTVSRRLGHSSVSVTELHYVDTTAMADRAAADASPVPSIAGQKTDAQKRQTPKNAQRK